MNTTTEQSASLGALAKALAAAQAEMGAAHFDSTNPHFKSRFASLAAVVEAVKPLHAHGIAYVQQPVTGDGLTGVRTMLLHESGEWMATTVWARPKDDGPQSVGSVLTYLRRYSLSAAAGIAADEDDDAEVAQPTASKPAPAPQPAPWSPNETLAQITLALGKMDIKTPGARLVWVSGMLGRKIANAKDLQAETRESLSKLLQAAINGEVPNDAEAA